MSDNLYILIIMGIIAVCVYLYQSGFQFKMQCTRCSNCSNYSNFNVDVKSKSKSKSKSRSKPKSKPKSPPQEMDIEPESVDLESLEMVDNTVDSDANTIDLE